MTAVTTTEAVDLRGSRLTRVRAHLHSYAGNPLLVRDLRAFLRGRRPLTLQLGYLLVTMVAMLIAALLCRAERGAMAYYSYSGPPTYGLYMFTAIFETQFALLALITIAYCAGAITLEHEKRTYEMLAVTTLSSFEVVVGKVMAVVALDFLLLFTSLPLAALCILLGGVSPGEALLAYGMLAAALPLWAASCTLISSLVPRTISAYVSGMLWLFALLFGTAFLSIPSGHGDGLCIGVLNPALACPGAMEYGDFGFYGKHFPAWITPLLLNGLGTVLCLVAAAEALPQHRPRRSTALRALLLTTCFLLVFLLGSALLTSGFSASGGPALTAGAWDWVAQSLQEAWLFALLVLPLVSSYPPPPEAYRRPLAWLLGPVPWRTWFQRATNVGWRTVFILFGAMLLAMVVPLVLARWAGMLPKLGMGEKLPFALATLALYALSLCAYAAWGAGLAFALRERRLTIGATVLLFLALNVLAVSYETDPDMFKRVPFLAHPAVQVISPVPAASALLGGSHGLLWGKQWSSPWYAVVLPLLYHFLLLLAGLAYVRSARARPVAVADPLPAPAGLTESAAVRDTVPAGGDSHGG